MVGLAMGGVIVGLIAEGTEADLTGRGGYVTGVAGILLDDTLDVEVGTG